MKQTSYRAKWFSNYCRKTKSKAIILYVNTTPLCYVVYCTLNTKGLLSKVLSE